MVPLLIAAGRVVGPLAARAGASTAARLGAGETGQAIAGAAAHGAAIYGMHEAVQRYQHRKTEQKQPVR